MFVPDRFPHVCFIAFILEETVHRSGQNRDPSSGCMPRCSQRRTHALPGAENGEEFERSWVFRAPLEVSHFVFVPGYHLVTVDGGFSSFPHEPTGTHASAGGPSLRFMVLPNVGSRTTRLVRFGGIAKRNFLSTQFPEPSVRGSEVSG